MASAETPEPGLTPEVSATADATATPEATTPAGIGDAAGRRRRRRLPVAAVRHAGGGIGAVGVKELRGRMRGRRAFVILTVYLLLLAGFAWMIELMSERTVQSNFGGVATFASAQVGQAIFASLLMLETLQVVFLAPAATAGAISLEREKRTLDLLVVTPISSLAIVVGKLVSALIYVWLLIAASIPLTAVVFVFGGVAPEDVVRGYVVLVITALGFGALGLIASSLVQRTQAATAITVFGVLVLTIGTVFGLIFWQAMASSDGGRGTGPIKGSPPQVIAWLNPFIAQIDVLCGTETSFGGWCQLESQLIPDPNGIIFLPGGGSGPTRPVAPGIDAPGVVTPEMAIAMRQKAIAVANSGVGPNTGVVAIDGGGAPAPQIAPDVAPFGVARDSLWPKFAGTWLVLSVVFVMASVQLVAPTRRWRLRRGRRAEESAA